VSGYVAVAQYAYYSWGNQGGRLQQITAGVPGTPSSLQDLRYTYDSVGNVMNIQDYKAGNPQLQTFSYDPLYRLLSANATGGSEGLYSEGYSYNTANGNLLTKNGLTYTYDSNHKHAVATLSNGNTYGYDSNGNMTQRHVYESGAWKDYTLAYDAENHLTNVTGAATAQFKYNGDGQRIVATEGVTTTVYVGNHFEWVVNNSTMKKYYYAGSTRVAMREGSGEPLWLLGDHLGGTNKVAFYNGTFRGEQRYKAWGEARFVSGDIPTDFKFTGQREDYYIKLYWYESRWFDPELGRFLSPDSIVPEASQGVQAWDRYAYVNNNPVLYNDPSGHCLILCTAIIGAAIGAIVGAVGYTAYAVATGTEFNAGHMLIAAGAGAIAGAIIGSGVGLIAGAAIATTAAETAVAANNACGGDMCASEVQDLAKAAEQNAPAIARSLGQAGEEAAEIVKNTTRIPSLTDTANYRVPDQFIEDTITEVKNVAYQSLTNQIRDFVLYAQDNGLKFTLIVGMVHNWVTLFSSVKNPGAISAIKYA
jgi:RHS repeat-associated protein